MEVQRHEVRSVFLAASYLKMNTMVKECAKHFIKNLTVENCIDVRSLQGISKKKSFVCQLDEFISAQVIRANYL